MSRATQVALRLGLASALLLGLGGLIACKGEGGDAPRNARGGRQRASGPVPVELAKAEQRAVPWRKRYVGRVVALKEHLLRPEGEGPIARVLVREGQAVAAGAPLVAMDAAPAAQALARAEANLARARANAQLARVQAQRFGTLLGQGFVSRAEADTQRTAALAAEEDRRAAQAERDLARRTWDRATLRAPFAGLVQELRAVPGAWARPADEALLRLVDARSLELRAAVPQSELADLRAAGRQAVARARLRGDQGPWVPGDYLGLDAALDSQSLAATARVRFRGPGLPVGGFAELELTLPVAQPRVAVPVAAVQQGQQGPFVYVSEGGKAAMRQVTVLREAEGWAALSEGPAVGAEVVVDGFARLAPGAELQAVEGDLAPPLPREGRRRREGAAGAPGEAAREGAEADGAASRGARRRRAQEGQP